MFGRRALEAAHAAEVAALKEEIFFLRAQNERLTEHRLRVERAEAGLPEAQPTIRPPVEPIPDAIERIIRLYGEARTRTFLRASCHDARKKGQSWETVEQSLRASIPPEALRGLDTPPAAVEDG